MAKRWCLKLSAVLGWILLGIGIEPSSAIAGTVKSEPGHIEVEDEYYIFVNKGETLTFAITSDSNDGNVHDVEAVYEPEGGAEETLNKSGEGTTEATATLVIPDDPGEELQPGAVTLTFSHTVDGDVCTDAKEVVFNLFPGGVKVNDTTKEEDDFVAVSKGTDEDLATDFSVEISGIDGLSAELKVKGADGGIKFKDQTLTLTDGVEAKTKLWGTLPSSDKDETIIEITMKKDGKEVGKIEEKVTVFKGAKLEFKGTFVANVNSIPEKWRPSPGRAGEAAASAQDVQEYVGLLQFQDKDQSKARRGWTSAPSVTIVEVETVDPNIVLDAKIEVLKNAQISAKSGFFQPGASHPRSNEKILDFKVELRESAGGDVYATASIDNANANAHQKHPSGDLGSLAGWTKQADIESKIDGDTAGADIKQFYKSRWGDIDNFLKIRQQWKNSNLIFSKQPMTKKSIAIKGLLGAQEVKSDPKSAIQCDFQRYNIWYLEGEVSDGLLTSEALP